MQGFAGEEAKYRAKFSDKDTLYWEYYSLKDETAKSEKIRRSVGGNSANGDGGENGEERAGYGVVSVPFSGQTIVCPQYNIVYNAP